MIKTLKRMSMLIAAPLAGLALALTVTATSASASTAATPAAIYHSYHLYNKLAPGYLSNCPYASHIYRQIGTASFSPPRDYANREFYNEWVGDLHYERYYQDGFTTAIVNLGCVNHDWVDMYYGRNMAYRIQYITLNCYDAGCSGATSYSAWKAGWAFIP